MDFLQSLSETKLLWMARQLRNADWKSRRFFFQALFVGLSDEERILWFRRLSYYAYPKSRWMKIERWMERRYETNLDWTPRKMASVCLNYMRIDSRMFPFLIKTAQRVKNRIHMRMKRREEREGGIEDFQAGGDLP